MATTERARITGFFVIGFLVGLATMWALVKSGTIKISADVNDVLTTDCVEALIVALDDYEIEPDAIGPAVEDGEITRDELGRIIIEEGVDLEAIWNDLQRAAAICGVSIEYIFRLFLDTPYRQTEPGENSDPTPSLEDILRRRDIKLYRT